MKRGTYLAIASGILFLDQAAKVAILSSLSPQQAIPLIPGLFQLVRVENPGIVFGLLADSSSELVSAVTLLLSGAALALVCFLVWKSEPSSKSARMGLAFILGGAAGNFLDRVLRGSVVDFLDFSLGQYHWPAFNLADSAIVVGAGLVLWELVGLRSLLVDRKTVLPPEP